MKEAAKTQATECAANMVSRMISERIRMASTKKAKTSKIPKQAKSLSI